MCSKPIVAVFFGLLIVEIFSNDYSTPLEDVVVLDNIFTSKELRNLRDFLSHEETLWSFEPYVGLENPFYTSTSHLWSTILDVEMFKNSSICRKIERGLINMSYGWTFPPYKVEGQISVRGDHIKPSGCQGEGFIATIFLVKNWTPNWYGEMVIYNQQGEITKTIVPQYGRLAVVPCGLSLVVKPPAIDSVLQRFHSLSVIFQTSDKPADQTAERKSMKEFLKEKENLYKFGLLMPMRSPSPPANKLDVEKYVTSRFTTANGCNILVLDGIIPEPILDALAYTVRNGGYADAPAGPDSSDNVQWILAFEVAHFLQTPLWPITHDVVTYISGRDTFFPYDIGCNNIQGRDSPQIHTDCAPTEDEYTLLIYLNTNWTGNLHGETVFFSDMSGSDFLFALKPKYGRVAIFHGTIPHSGRPPSLSYQGARFTFAVKMAASKKLALQKSIREALDDPDDEETEKITHILHDIKVGKMSTEEVENIVSEYEVQSSTRETLIPF